MSDLYVAISSNGQMTGNEMLTELKESRVIPIMTFVSGGETIVPLFNSKLIAKGFGARNTPKNYTIGVMLVTDDDLESISNQGWGTVVLDFPSKRDIVVEILEIDREVMTHSSKRK